MIGTAHILARAGLFVLALGLSFSLAHALSGKHSLEYRRRKMFTRVERVLLTACGLFFALEIAAYLIYWRGSPSHPWSWGSLFALSGWAAGSYLVMFLCLLAGGLIFYRVHLPPYVSLRKKIGDPETPLAELSRIGGELEKCRNSWPAWMNSLLVPGLHNGYTSRMTESSDLQRAALNLERGNMTEALKGLLKWDSSAPETLLLGVECREWKEVRPLLRLCREPLLRKEAAQAMAYNNLSNEFLRIALESLREEPKSGRRCAMLQFQIDRSGIPEGLSSDDWEAMNWFHSVSE